MYVKTGALTMKTDIFKIYFLIFNLLTVLLCYKKIRCKIIHFMHTVTFLLQTLYMSYDRFLPTYIYFSIRSVYIGRYNQYPNRNLSNVANKIKILREPTGKIF